MELLPLCGSFTEKNLLPYQVPQIASSIMDIRMTSTKSVNRYLHGHLVAGCILKELQTIHFEVLGFLVEIPPWTQKNLVLAKCIRAYPSTIIPSMEYLPHKQILN